MCEWVWPGAQRNTVCGRMRRLSNTTHALEGGPRLGDHLVVPRLKRRTVKFEAGPVRAECGGRGGCEPANDNV